LDKDLEKAVKDEGYLATYYLHHCKSKYAVHSDNVYRMNSNKNDDLNLYEIFIPINLKLTVSKYIDFMRFAEPKLATKLPEDLNDLCISVGVSQYFGHTLRAKLGRLKNVLKENELK